MAKKVKGKAGRPRAKIDWKEVEKLLEAGCKTSEVAGYFGVDPDTLYRRCQEDNNIEFTVLKREKRKKGDAMIRLVQFKKCMQGDNITHIWLGKQRLGQTEPKDKQGKTKIELPKIEIMIDNANE